MPRTSRQACRLTRRARRRCGRSARQSSSRSSAATRDASPSSSTSPGPSLHAALARPPADTARGGGRSRSASAIAANTTIFNLASQLLFAVPSATSPDRLVHIWVGGGSNVSHRQWRALEESGALEGLTGFNIETSVNWRGPDRTLNLDHDGGRRQLLRRCRRPDGARPRVHAPRGASGAATRRSW